ncbi:hypothetical protein Acr_22g0009870 [Actinidia rufa]|uniref:Uncharacterized protein n=1 Tax=Actinidia rufa TaxID=165716 RepID=A0A7J0GL88_9ERIC|nr:hypothetical protein Acr_22g0009870 [Actinidia rufa]
MASQSTNGGGSSLQTRKERPLVPRTPGGGINYWPMSKGGQGPLWARSGQLLFKGEEDSQNVTIRCLKVQLAELQQVLVANNLIRLALGVGEGLSEVRSTRRKDAPRGGRKGKKGSSSYTEAESQSDNRTMAIGRQRVPPSRIGSVWTFVRLSTPNEAGRMGICG